MLVIEISRIPPEGMDVSEGLDAGGVHVEGEESFALEAGGRLDGRVERGDGESVHVRGRIEARLGLICGRCLEPFPLPLAQEVDVFYLPQRAPQEVEDEVELSDHDMVVSFYRGDRLDLGEMVREQLFLSLPMKRLCRDDCRGLCPRCGTNRNLSACGCAPEEPDLRLSALKSLFEKS